MGRILGIDLGTSTSEAAYYVSDNAEIIKDKQGKYIIPSYVNIAEDGTVTVGEEAKDKFLLEPHCTFMEVKRLLGSNKKLTAHNKEYLPCEISAHILSYLAGLAEEMTGEKFTSAVITVPAYFTDRQRRETIRAGEIAGLTVERIINEPTAAALSYGVAHLEDEANILVYDFGGGTLDVTLLEMFAGVLEVKASNGINNLGGKDFDELLIEHLLCTFSDEHKQIIKNDIRAMARLKKEAEQCKIALSEKEEYLVSLPFLAKSDDKVLAIEKTITRKKFEGIIAPKVASTREPIDMVLKDSNMKKDNIDMVLLVGGTTRIPYIRTFVEDVMGQQVNVSLNPEEAVVRGAAAQAAIIADETNESNVILVDVCPYTLGVEVVYRENDDDEYISGRRVDPLIKRNMTIPRQEEKQYFTVYDRQTQALINVYQGEYSEPERNNFLGGFMIDGIPRNKRGKEVMRIIFSYDLNGILNVEAYVVSNGEHASVSIATADQIMVDEIDISDWKNKPNAKKYAAVLKRAERMMQEDLEISDYEELSDCVRTLKENIVLERSVEDMDVAKDELLECIFSIIEEEDD